MKLKKVAALCIRQEAFHLFDEVTEGGELIRQWLGNGYAIYPLSGLPVLDESNLCAMFDVSDKKRKKCFFSRKPMPESLNVEDYARGERTLYDEWPTVEHNGYAIKPLSASDDMLFIQTAYLAPLEDMADYLRFYERVDNTGQKYIVAKNGMEIAAIIMPYDIISAGFVEELENLAFKCRKTLDAKKEQEYLKAVERKPGPLFREGDDAEEGAGE